MSGTNFEVKFGMCRAQTDPEPLAQIPGLSLIG